MTGWRLAALCLAPLIYLTAIQPSTRWALAEEASRSRTVLSTGHTWRFDHPEVLVGGQPAGTDRWYFTDNSLVLSAATASSYLALNFDGRRLPAGHLPLLLLDLNVQRPVAIRLYHRTSLSGPAARTTPIDLASGRQQLLLNLASVDWELKSDIDITPTVWGQDNDLVATLRLHTTTVEPVRLELFEVALLPQWSTALGTLQDTGPDIDQPVDQPVDQKWDQNADEVAARAIHQTEAPVARPSGAAGRTWWWSSRKARVRLGQLRHGPGFVPNLSDTPPPPHALPYYLLLAVLVLTAARAPRWRPLVALVLLSTTVWWCFSQPQWDPVLLVICALSLLGCAVVAGSTPRAARTIPSASTGAPDAVSRSPDPWRDLARLLLATVVLLALFLVSGNGVEQWRLSPPRWLTYLAWACLQQWVLCRIIFPLARRCSSPVAPWAGSLIAAGFFGWVHLPNLELMILTWLLALGCLWHYQRHHRLLQPVLFHTAAGSLIMAATPSVLVYSASVGPGFWQ